VCELIPSFILSLYSPSSTNFVVTFQRLNFMCWVMSYPLRNGMLRCFKSELEPKNLLRSARGRGNFSHSGLRWGEGSGASYSFREVPRKTFRFCFYFLSFTFQISFSLFYSLSSSLLFLRFRCLNLLSAKRGLTNLFLFTATSPDSPINALFALISCPEVF